MSTIPLPTYIYEQELLDQGFKAIVGIDEAGCGALAGPVVAGAILLRPGSELEGVKDSKLMSEKQREEMYELVTKESVAWAAGQASVEEIYKIGIRPATYLAMRRALEQIEEADFALVDAWTIPEITIKQRGVIKGDRKIISIAAASIIAKVTRDRIMQAHSDQYPQYGFGVHKGYGTKVHREAIATHGACPIHRLGYKTFQPKLV